MSLVSISILNPIVLDNFMIFFLTLSAYCPLALLRILEELNHHHCIQCHLYKLCCKFPQVCIF